MYRIYQIEDETSLDDIAKKFNTTVQNLKQINGILNDYNVQRGSYIIVPISDMEDGNFEIYRVKQGDSIYSIAQEFGLNYLDVLNLNGLDRDQYIYPNQEIMIPKKDLVFIITKENETLSDAASRLNTTEEEIIRQNRTIYLVPDQLMVYKKRV